MIIKPKTVVLSILFLSVLVTASCGGGSSEDGPAGLGVCDPPSAPVGAQVTCTVDGGKLDADCTLFFGGTPVEATVNEEEGTVTFTVPPGAPGPREITFQCGGGDPKTIANDFAVSAPPPPIVAACEDNSDCSGGLICQGGSCVTPSAPAAGCVADTDCPSGMTCQGGSCVEVVTPSGPECSAESPCSGGRVCQEGVCVEPPAPSTDTGPVTVTVDDSTARHNETLGLVEIKWRTTGSPDEVYLYAPFNRKSSDGGCGRIGGRYLAVSSGGDEIIEGTANYETYEDYLTGAKCNVADGNCRGLTAAEAAGAVHCRIDLEGSSGRFYTRMRVGTFRLTIAARDAEGAWHVDEKAFNAPAASISDPVIEFQEGDFKFVFNYERATAVSIRAHQLSHPRPGVIVFYLADDPNRRDFSPPDNGSGTAVASFEFQDRIRDYTITAQGLGATVRKSYRIQCGAPELSMQEGEFFRTGTDAPATDDEAGEIQFFGRLTRQCHIFEHLGWNEPCATCEFGSPDWTPVFGEGEPIDVPWVKDMRLVAVGSSCDDGDRVTFTAGNWGGIVEGNRAEISARLPRNHSCHRYKLSGHDVDGSSFSTGVVSRPYQAWFRVHGFNATCGSGDNYVPYWSDPGTGDGGRSCAEPVTEGRWYGCEGSCWSYDDAFCRGGSGYGDDQCLEDPRIEIYGNWQGQHIKRIYSPNCGGELTIPQPDGGRYDVQGTSSGSLIRGTFNNPRINHDPDRQDPDMPDAGWSTGMCYFEAETWDGTILRTSDNNQNHRNNDDPLAGIDMGCNC